MLLKYVFLFGEIMQKNILVSNTPMPRFKPVVAGFEDCKKGHSYGPAVRHQWLIHFVVSGRGYFKINGKQHTLSAGHMFVIPPYVKVFYAADEEKPWEYIWIGFQAEGDLPCALNETLYLPKAKKIFDAIKTSAELTTARAAFLTARLWDLFALILEDNTKQTDYAETIRDIILSEYADGISVSEIAKRLNMNRSYLSTIFKDKYGIPPKQYLLEHRMSMAATLLQRGNKVNITADSVGYTDAFVFSKAFKQHYGLSPLEYAKHKRLKQQKS